MTDLHKLVKIAHYYYRDGLTQKEIADKLSMSRQNVNRILKRIVEEGIVKIEIVNYMAANVELERKLERAFGLKDAVIISDLDDSSIIERLAQVGASYVHEMLETKKTFGIGNGRILRNMVEYVKERHKDVSVVQIAGGMPYTEIDDLIDINNQSDEIIIQLSQRIGAVPYFMHVPIFVENSETKKALMEEQFVKNSFDMIDRCDFAVLSIEGINEDITLFKEQYLGTSYLSQLINGGAVGNICSRYFDINGTQVHSSLEDRTMVPELEQLKKIPQIIGIGAGKNEHAAILGALRGKLINVLITNIETAQYLLENI